VLRHRATARLNAIEIQQNILHEKLSSILAFVDANTATLSELMTLLHKFMGSVKASDIVSPSESKSAVEHRSISQLCNVEGLAMPLTGGNEHYTKATL
jgi:DNA uptake protein ComE-like DNA-binding protein